MDTTSLTFSSTGWRILKKSIETMNHLSLLTYITFGYGHPLVIETQDKEIQCHVMYMFEPSAFTEISLSNTPTKICIDTEEFSNAIRSSKSKVSNTLIYDGNNNQLKFRDSIIQALPPFAVRDITLDLRCTDHFVVDLPTDELGRIFCDTCVGIDDIVMEANAAARTVSFKNKSYEFIARNVNIDTSNCKNRATQTIKTGDLMIRLLTPLGKLNSVSPTLRLHIFQDSLRVSWKHNHVKLQYVVAIWRGYKYT
jgi:hypothetical protein